MIKKICNNAKFIFIIILLCLVLYSLNLNTIFDEDYSLKLVNNSFPNIISIDSLDVHPPLFYFLLKIFLQITAFWTKSFFIKVVLSRIFIVIISIITFYFLLKISNELFVELNLLTQWFVFLLVPGVVSFTYEFIKIRMYSLGALFIVVDFYSLLKFYYNKNNSYLILSTLLTTLSAYTNYYAAAISGFILIMYIFIYMFHSSKLWMKIFIVGIISSILFSLWIPILIKQLYLQNQHPQGGFIKQWIATLLLILVFVNPLLWSIKHYFTRIGFTFINSFIILLVTFLFMSILSFIDQPMFQFRYIYPIFIIYGFLGIDIMIIEIQKYNKHNSLLPKLFMILITLLCLGSYVEQEYKGVTSSYDLISSSYKFKKRHVIKLRSNAGTNINIEKSIYFSRYGRIILAPRNINYVKNDLPYRKLFKNVTSNIIFYK